LGGLLAGGLKKKGGDKVKVEYMEEVKMKKISKDQLK